MDNFLIGIVLGVLIGVVANLVSWWVNNIVWAIDPTGKFILEEKIRAKLLHVPPPLRIAPVTKGRLEQNYREIPGEGWTLARYRTGSVSPETFTTLDDLLRTLITESA